MTSKCKVYLAGPEVFLQNAKEVLDHKLDICARMGLDGMIPVDDGIANEQPTKREMALAIYRGNVLIMDQADAVIANVTPFRGPHMDPGTAFELGYCSAKGKIVICYTQQEQDLLERVIRWSGQPTQSVGGRFHDKNGHFIEDFGLKENLMIESTVDYQGHPMVVSEAPPEQAFVCLLGFEMAAEHLAKLIKKKKA